LFRQNYQVNCQNEKLMEQSHGHLGIADLSSLYIGACHLEAL